MFAVCSLKSTLRQAVAPSALGLTQASSVIPVVRSSEFESGTVTRVLVPLKVSAPPECPATAHAPLATVPLLPVPERSASAVPEPALKLYEATRPVGGGGAVFDTVTVTAAAVVGLPAASRATAVSVCDPFAAVVVSQETLYGVAVSSAPRFAPSRLNCTPTTPT